MDILKEQIHRAKELMGLLSEQDEVAAEAEGMILGIPSEQLSPPVKNFLTKSSFGLNLVPLGPLKVIYGTSRRRNDKEVIKH